MTRPPLSKTKVSVMLAADGAPIPASPNGRPATAVGSSRLSLATGYFAIMAWLMGMISVGMAAALMFPRLGWRVEPANEPYVSLATAVILTFGFARTRRLLRARSRTGGWLALTMFAIDLIEDFATGSRGWPAIAFSALGLVLIGSIWKYLDEDEP
jgi:hypothetical protein